MIPDILQFIYDNSSKEFSCPFFKNFIKKKIEKKIKIKIIKNREKHKNSAKIFGQCYVHFLVFSRVGIVFPNMEKFKFSQLINYQLIN